MLTLRRAGVSDARVLAAFDACRRERFIDAAYADLAQEDVAVPLVCGQVSLRPSALAMMLEALDVQPENSLLLIGAGAGYSAAIAGRVAQSVTALERYRSLANAAAVNLASDGVVNAHVSQADGLAPLEDGSAFDRILLTGSISASPDHLLAHLSSGGILVAPMSDARNSGQNIVQLWRAGETAPAVLFAMDADPLEPGLPQFL